MKVVILAGGLGTRISEESEIRPKPMIEIGGMPILWHIMKIYSTQGFNEFIICLGYKGFIIKEYFANYFLHLSDVTIELSTGKIEVHNCKSENIKMTLIDTGIRTQTGGRIKRIGEYVGNESFMLTYGDGLADINIKNLLKFHKENNKLATVTAVRPPGRFGSLILGDDSKVIRFEEKPLGDGSWINGGFFVLEPEVLNYIEDDNTYWEREPMVNLASDGQLSAYEHEGFWKPMDTLRDKTELEYLWDHGKAPWKIWE
jgi:glucose-1-phosphate cytidylyltransferase